MSFASLEFFLFLPVVFLVYHLGNGSRWQNSVLVAASYFFYGWWDYRFCALMLASSLIDYFGGLGIAATNERQTRKPLLITTLALNLLILGFFKYFNFFVDSLVIATAAAGIDLNTSTLSIVLPIGISFYTFQTMSYTLDVYRGDTPAQKNLLDYLAFVSFFPQLVAGPIERARDLLPQFQQTRTFSRHEAEEGCRLILWGLFKKMVLADNLASLVDPAFASPDQATGASLVLATFGFAFQIYCDFSAYSDIATGSAALFGIRLMRNFDTPYFARSIGEFWRRWHISLSTWFRDYVYVPLGGNRWGRAQTIRNLLFTFLLSGLWHGAAWKFVLWGGLHGLFLSTACFFRGDTGFRAGFKSDSQSIRPSSPAAEEGSDEADFPIGAARRMAQNSESRHLDSYGKAGFFKHAPRPFANPKPPANAAPHWKHLPAILGTFALVCAGWIVFRADSLTATGAIFRTIATSVLSGPFYLELLRLLLRHFEILSALAIFIALEWRDSGARNPMPVPARSVAGRWAIYTVLFWVVLLFGTQQTADFIYFQF